MAYSRAIGFLESPHPLSPTTIPCLPNHWQEEGGWLWRGYRIPKNVLILKY